MKKQTKSKPFYRVNDILLTVNVENVNHVIDRTPENNYILEVRSDEDPKEWVPIGIFKSKVRLVEAMQSYERNYLGEELEGSYEEILNKLEVSNMKVV